MVRYGSDSLRKYTGPKYVRPIRVFTKRGSCERSRRLPTSFGAKRDTSSCTLPVASSWTSSVMAGTSRSRRRKSISRCSRASAGSVKGTSIAARTCSSIPFTNCSMRVAAARACWRWSRTSAAFVCR